MGRAKDIRVDVISPRVATAFVKREHYSGKTPANTQLHLGVTLDDRLEGVLQFGPPLDRRKLLGLVRDTPWNGMCELNRMVFTEALPRNSESRALGVAMRILRRNAPSIEWVVSFADATQCGDGTIYRASGFVLTGIKANKNLARLPSGEVIHKLTVESNPTKTQPYADGRSMTDITGGRYDWNAYVHELGGEILTGHHLRYIYFLHPTARERLTVPEIPFTEIANQHATMYRGQPHAADPTGGTRHPAVDRRFDSDPAASTTTT